MSSRNEQRSNRVASFAEFDRRAREGEMLSIVFFGGSLTWGANASDPNLTSWRGLMMGHLRERYPKSSFAFHDAAIGGTGSRLGMFRLERDVLSQRPDLVFLDFTVNDDADSDDPEALPSYEYLVRKMVGSGIPVVQVFSAFRRHLMPACKPCEPARFAQHRALADAYHTATANVLACVRHRVQSGLATLDEIWPFEGFHPDDIGYRFFFEAVRDGLESAIQGNRVCHVPAQTVYPEKYRRVSRVRLVEQPMPVGWRREKTYRTALWFDGLSSRWMGDVLVCDATIEAQSIKMEFTGTLVGIFGEADENGMAFRVQIDGQPIANPQAKPDVPVDHWPTTAKAHGVGRLFFWREITWSLPSGKHVLELWPVGGSAKWGQLRIESICIAGE